MFHSIDQRKTTPKLLFAAATCLMLIVGCEKEYKPAPYAAAPRVDAAMLDDSNADTASGVAFPDVTDWTSPDAIRATRRFAPPKIGRFYAGNSYRGNAYRGYRRYSGISQRGYSGMAGRGAGYRGYGQTSTYRGFRKPSPYRGNANQRSGSYRGYRK